jgi:hypothetical protein
MGTNHFGHFLLTSLLLGVLKRTGRGARVVTVSSRAHRRATGFHIDDLNHERPGAYAAFEVYSQSKLANVLFSNELARRLEADGLVRRLPHPTDGRTTLVQITDIGRSTVEDATVTVNKVFANIGISAEQARALVESIESLRHHAGDF